MLPLVCVTKHGGATNLGPTSNLLTSLKGDRHHQGVWQKTCPDMKTDAAEAAESVFFMCLLDTRLQYGMQRIRHVQLH